MCSYFTLDEKLKTETFICDSNPPEMLKCKFCEFEAHLKVDLTEHFRVFHAGKEINKELENITKCNFCNNCNFDTYSLLVLTKHVGGCMKGFTNNLSENGESTVVSIGNWFKCVQCAFKCNKKWRLRRHIIGRHANPEDIDWFICGQCSFKTKQEYCLKLHTEIKHSNAEHINWLKCGQCSFQTKRKRYMTRHVMIQHTNPEDINWFECEQCAFKTKRNADLKRHVLAKHTDPDDINWLKCDQCAFKTKRKTHLKRHVICIHTNTEDISWFECEQCTYKTKLKDALTRHGRSHTKIKKKIGLNAIKAEESDLKQQVVQIHTTP